MNSIPIPRRRAKHRSGFVFNALRSLLIALLCALPVGSSWAEEYYDEVYDTSDAHQQPYDSPEQYPDDSQLDDADTYDDSNAHQEEPTMDPEHAEMVRDAKASCAHWATESGLEGEEMQTFIDDCVRSQTGY